MSAHAVVDRAHVREVLAQIAQKAKDRLPQATNGRLEAANRLVLLDEVTVLDNGTITVGSLDDPSKTYLLEGTSCTCQDYDRAPDHWCKHRIAAGLHKRLHQVLAAGGAPLPTRISLREHYDFLVL